ncbi:hypothetical protein ANCDUO_08371 [Ancylostoma duodenale]|uniref:Uncharacterized protein n=1 Tax=Ancylostoma duodenale TaxID=51022 RepID=A0A0C2DFZ8_9BILA|nr:hypothetical protein ANCDUO_08371 [Ancylostoma duodenale]
MIRALKEVLGEINTKLTAVNDELNAKMAESVNNSRPAQQAQYCGPYKLEKTLGKGQTGRLFVLSTKSSSFFLRQGFTDWFAALMD